MSTTFKLSLVLITLLAIVCAASLLIVSPSTAAQSGVVDDYYLTLEPLVDAPNDPVGLAHAGDDRLFVVERIGTIRIIEDGALLPEPFLDISDQVARNNWEQGLLGLAFHPDYEQNGTFYVYYTDVEGESRLSRFQVSDDDPDSADAGSEELLLFAEQPEYDHNAGALAFGPDGYLYVALGDGGLHTGFANAQSKDNLLGKLLRIDVDGETGTAPDCGASDQTYTVPADNPFHDGPGGDCDEIWVMGLRNPWRFSFDSVSGDLFIGDVGLGRYEEVNVLPAGAGGGANFGWPCYEGHIPFKTELCSDTDQFVFPVAGYERGDTTCVAMVGGAVYHGQDEPEMEGHYLFADFCSGQMWRLRADGDGWQQRVVANAGHTITSIAADRHGEFYATSLAGGVYRLHAEPAPYHGYLPLLAQP